MTDKHRLLELALKGLEAERAQIDNEITQIQGQLKNGTVTRVGVQARRRTVKKRRKMSAEAKRKISEAMKRRYVEIRKGAKKAA